MALGGRGACNPVHSLHHQFHCQGKTSDGEPSPASPEDLLQKPLALSSDQRVYKEAERLAVCSQIVNVLLTMSHESWMIGFPMARGAQTKGDGSEK